MSEWISVNERLPEEPNPEGPFPFCVVLLNQQRGRFTVRALAEYRGSSGFRGGIWEFAHRCGAFVTPVLVTHWMPLPEPPAPTVRRDHE